MTVLEDASDLFTIHMWLKMRSFRFDGEPNVMIPKVNDGEFLWVWSECLHNSQETLEVDGIISQFYRRIPDGEDTEHVEPSLSMNTFIGVREDRFSDCQADDNDYCNCYPCEYKPLAYQFGEEMCEICWLRYHRVVTSEMCGSLIHQRMMEDASG